VCVHSTLGRIPVGSARSGGTFHVRTHPINGSLTSRTGRRFPGEISTKSGSCVAATYRGTAVIGAWHKADMNYFCGGSVDPFQGTRTDLFEHPTNGRKLGKQGPNTQERLLRRIAKKDPNTLTAYERGVCASSRSTVLGAPAPSCAALWRNCQLKA